MYTIPFDLLYLNSKETLHSNICCEARISIDKDWRSHVNLSSAVPWGGIPWPVVEVELFLVAFMVINMEKNFRQWFSWPSAEDSIAKLCYKHILYLGYLKAACTLSSGQVPWYRDCSVGDHNVTHTSSPLGGKCIIALTQWYNTLI